MHLLGRNLIDHRPVRIALTQFYGIGMYLSSRLIARLQIHRSTLVSDLTEQQINALSAYLSSPTTNAKPPPMPLSKPQPPPGSVLITTHEKVKREKVDPLDALKIETDLKRKMLADIAHHRTVGSYVGRRHGQGYPVRGQRTKTNAYTARRLNRVERRFYSTSPTVSSATFTPSSTIHRPTFSRFSSDVSSSRILSLLSARHKP